MTPLTMKAMCFARTAHHGQSRDSSIGPIPYFMHCIDVVERLYLHKTDLYYDSTIYTVAFLHDVVEDTPTTTQDIAQEFGNIIANYVDLLSLPPEAKTPALKTQYQLNVMSMDTADNLVRGVKIADKTSNVHDMVRYKPDWTEKGIRGYLQSALEVVEEGMKCSPKNPWIAGLVHDFKTEYTKAISHYGITP